MDVKGNIPPRFRFPLKNANSAELLSFEEGTEILIQRLDSHPFIIELYQLNNSESLHFKIDVMKARLCLFFMIEGIGDFFSGDGKRISHLRTKRFFLNYISKGEYQVNISSDQDIALIVTIKPSWTKKFFGGFPRLYDIMCKTETNDFVTKVLPQCYMDATITKYLEEIYNYSNDNPGALNGTLRTYISLILERYEVLLMDKIASISYRAKDFIEVNFSNPGLSIEDLASDLATTTKTLTKHFKYEFGVTPYAYLIEVRLWKARELIKKGNLKPKDVYWQVGYDDVKSFRIQYRKSFGNYI